MGFHSHGYMMGNNINDDNYGFHVLNDGEQQTIQ